MARLVEPVQDALVGHRRTFFGHPGLNGTTAWDYQGRVWAIKRPADGKPGVRHCVTCLECGRRLTYHVYSVAETRRRRIARWVGAAVCFPGWVAAMLAVGARSAGNAPPLVITMGSVPLLYLMIFWLGMAAAREIGVAGRGSTLPLFLPKHKVFLRSQYNGDWV
ncbi:hypothetical protein [Cryptosporangium sp. NPDC048952]|uniref:hypothetical protein n=1 Tax=Cryptosporangium sp. NPDC048952 TaxID=3363961 RepID=UPI00372439F3